MRNASNVVRASSCETPESRARSPAASVMDMGRARCGPPSGRRVNPRFNSTQIARGSFENSSVDGHENSVLPTACGKRDRIDSKLSWRLVIRSSVSPMTFEGGIACPKSFEATVATVVYVGVVRSRPRAATSAEVVDSGLGAMVSPDLIGYYGKGLVVALVGAVITLAAISGS